MFRISVLFLLICLLPFSSFAAEKLPTLKTFDFGYVKITYNPSVAVPEKKIEGSCHEGVPVDCQKVAVLTAKVTPGGNDYKIKISLDKSGGATITVEDIKQHISYDFNSTQGITLLGDGFIYTTSWDMLEWQKKYKIENGKLIEVKQPFYYLGEETEVLKQITLYSDKNRKEVAVVLKPHEKVTLVLFEPGADGEIRNARFLLKTKTGITGWFTPSPGKLGGTECYELGDLPFCAD